MAKKPSPRPEAQIKYPRRGEIYLVNFNPTMGHEIRKTRPALILQNDIGNLYSHLTIVAAISSQTGNLKPVDVFIPAKKANLAKDSAILLNQIRTIDKRRLIKRLGKIGPETFHKVNHALKISLGLFI